MAFESIVNRRNRVPELQRLYQTNLKAPIYLRGGPRDKIVVYGAYSLLAFGVALTGYEFSKLLRA
ncbi:hypothetical protein H4R33_003496 [Dimargaris cristalligena]|nr:hypothetical protein H4R33_003496 [Dimargaris cristalligena]